MKKAVALLVSVILIVNIFCVSASAEGSSGTPGGTVAAVGVDDAIIGILGGAIVGLLSGAAAGASGDIANRLPSFALEWANDNAIRNGEVIQVEERLDANGNHSYYYFEPVSGLTGDEAECAQFLSDYMNNSGVCEQAADGFQQLNTGMGGIDATNYAALKTEAVNAFTAYIEAKQRDIALNDFESGMSALASALGHEWSPSYNFDFVGPMSPIEFEAQTSFLSDMLDYEGFRLYPAHATVLEHSNYSTYSYAFASEGAALAYVSGIPGATSMSVTLIDDNWRYYDGYIPVIEFESNTYELLGNYVIYNDEIYFNKKSTINNGYGSVNVTPNANSINNFYSASGVSLASAGCTDINGLYTGVYAKPTGSVASGDIPQNITVSDITDDADPLSFDYLYTEDELPVSNAIAAGIISNNPDLTIDQNGNIVAADNISLAQLQQIMQQIADDQIQFEDFEEYLNYITALLMKANVDRLTQTDVINGLRAYEQQQANALNQINSNISSIAAALTADYEYENEHDEGNMYIVEHAGLNEAVQIVNQSMPFVDQMRTLLSNLFGSNNNNNNSVSSAPNFHFYADLDHDGTNERYNAFDLSFLDTTLTNANLEDKGRFVQPITVRELLQEIILLIVYSFFCLRMLKRIPSLINGSASDESTTTIIRS